MVNMKNNTIRMMLGLAVLASLVSWLPAQKVEINPLSPPESEV